MCADFGELKDDFNGVVDFDMGSTRLDGASSLTFKEGARSALLSSTWCS